jgi:8-oxo-dGTP pyrophosphatase MutT (NUDIX family)
MAPNARASLPFREKTELFLLNGSTGRLIAQDKGRYVFFPGGGVDPGETGNIIASAKRELNEEVGATLVGPLTHLVTVDWVWFPEWADTPTRKERYKHFRGERVHVLVGRVEALRKGDKGTNADNNAWVGERTLKLQDCLDLMSRYGASDHPNTYSYRIAQQMAVEHLRLMAKCGETSAVGGASRRRVRR